MRRRRLRNVDDLSHQLAGDGGASSVLVPPDPSLLSNRGVARRARSGDRGAVLDPELQTALQRSCAGGRAVPGGLRSRFEAASGIDLRSVRVHDDARAAAFSDRLNADAFTTGNNIFLGRGRPVADNELLRHEMGHVVQNVTGRGPGPGQITDPNGPIERAADHVEPAQGVPANGIGGAGVSRQVATAPATGTSTDPGAGGSDAIEYEPWRYRVNIVGHASPRWRRPGASTAERRNLELSKRRAEAAEEAVRSAFRTRMMPIEFEFTSSIDDDMSLSTDWRGSTDTTLEAGGDSDSDLESLRRVDISIDVLRTGTGYAPSTEVVTAPSHSNKWQVKVDSVTGVTFAGSVQKGKGRIKSPETGQSARGEWLGFGGGTFDFDLPILPSQSDPSNWEPFTTDSSIPLGGFEDTNVRYSEVGASAGVRSAGFAILRFPWLSDTEINLSGFGKGGLGLGGSVTSGQWHFTEDIPPPTSTEFTRLSPYQVEDGMSYGARVLFDTSESALSNTALDEIQALVHGLP